MDPQSDKEGSTSGRFRGGQFDRYVTGVVLPWKKLAGVRQETSWGKQTVPNYLEW